MTSEEIHTGVVDFRPGSLTPVIREIKGESLKMISVMVEDYDKLRNMEGQEVQYTIIKNPYGPHIVSGHGFAKLL